AGHEGATCSTQALLGLVEKDAQVRALPSPVAERRELAVGRELVARVEVDVREEEAGLPVARVLEDVLLEVLESRVEHGRGREARPHVRRQARALGVAVEPFGDRVAGEAVPAAAREEREAEGERRLGVLRAREPAPPVRLRGEE